MLQFLVYVPKFHDVVYVEFCLLLSQEMKFNIVNCSFTEETD